MFVLVITTLKHMEQDTHVSGISVVGLFETREQAGIERKRMYPLLTQWPYVETKDIDIVRVQDVDVDVSKL